VAVVPVFVSGIAEADEEFHRSSPDVRSSVAFMPGNSKLRRA
jgi:hypothetical protein